MTDPGHGAKHDMSDMSDMSSGWVTHGERRRSGGSPRRWIRSWILKSHGRENSNLAHFVRDPRVLTIMDLSCRPLHSIFDCRL